MKGGILPLLSVMNYLIWKNLQSTIFKYLLKLLFQENSQTYLMQKHWKMVWPVTLNVLLCHVTYFTLEQ